MPRSEAILLSVLALTLCTRLAQTQTGTITGPPDSSYKGASSPSPLLPQAQLTSRPPPTGGKFNIDITFPTEYPFKCVLLSSFYELPR